MKNIEAVTHTHTHTHTNNKIEEKLCENKIAVNFVCPKIREKRIDYL